MEYKPTYNYTTKAIIFDLYKEIYGSAFSIYEGHIKGKDNWKIILNTPFGTATFKNFREYKKGAERIEMIYNFPDRPMIMWKRSLLQDIKTREKRKKAEKKNRIEDVSIPSDIKERLKEVALEQGWYQRKFI